MTPTGIADGGSEQVSMRTQSRQADRRVDHTRSAGSGCSHANAPALPTVAGHPGLRSSVLVVEDEAIIRLDLVTELEAHGLDVIEAAEAGSAMALFESEPVDAVVIDIGLPGTMSGYEFVRAVRHRCPACVVIIASGHPLVMPDDFDEHVMLQPKPYDPDKIAIMLLGRHSRAAATRQPSSEA